MQYNQYPIRHYETEVKALKESYGIKMYKMLQNGESEIKKVSFDSNTASLKQDCIHIFEGFKSDVMYVAQDDENSDIGTTYLGMPKMKRQDELKAEHKAPIAEDCYIPS